MRPARRIVSLLPAATDVVRALGLADRLVGISHECDDPAPGGRLPRVTRSLVPDGSSAEIDRAVRERVRARQPLYALDATALARLAPDLVITQALCDVCAVAEEDVRAVACALPDAPHVVNLEPRTLSDVLGGILVVADAAGERDAGERMVSGLETRIRDVQRRASARPTQRVAFLEWLDPPFGGGHWNPELVRMAGGDDPFGHPGEPARTITWPDVIAWRPEVMFVACCGHDAARGMGDFARVLGAFDWGAVPAVRSRRIWFADGARYFSRPGPGLVESIELLEHALEPDAHALPAEMWARAALRRSA